MERKMMKPVAYSNRPVISFRASKALQKIIDDKAKAKSKTRAEVLIEIIEQNVDKY